MMKRIDSFVVTVCLVALILGGYKTEAAEGDKPLDPNKVTVAIGDVFSPTGWMGDGEDGKTYIDFDGACKAEPHSGPFCVAVKYTFGQKEWAGVYWQNRADNWGDYPGNDYSLLNLRKLTFWARGKTGEEVIEFKAGDIKNDKKKYKDSFVSTLGRVTLTKEWKQYVISLENKDLTSVIGGFCWVASAKFNAQPSITFYLDDIMFE